MAEFNVDNTFVSTNVDSTMLNDCQVEAETSIYSRFEKILTSIEILGDWLAVTAAILSGYQLHRYFHHGINLEDSFTTLLVVSVIVATLNVILLDRDGAYNHGYSLLRIKETERSLRVSMQTMLLALPIMYFFHSQPSRLFFFSSLVCVPVLQVLERQILFQTVRALHQQGWGLNHVVIYGAGQSGQRIYSALVRSPKLGLQPVAMIDDNVALEGQEIFEDAYKHEHSISINAGPLTKARLKQLNCSLLIVALPSIQLSYLQRLANLAQESGTRLAFVPSQSTEVGLWTEHTDIDGTMLNVVGHPAKEWHYNLSKRIFDLCVSVGLVFVLLPLTLVLCLCVRIDSAGPLFFKQQRVGRNGKLFWLYKFRSMFVDAPQYTYSPTDARDARITRVGRFLRKTSMDELPQLINVIKGEMSLVGPRPEMPFIVSKYNAQHRLRLLALPGLTGLWQLSADRAFQIHENIQYDLYYIRNRSLFMDIAILIHTAFFAMNGI